MDRAKEQPGRDEPWQGWRPCTLRHMMKSSFYRLAANVCSSRNEIGGACSRARCQALEKAPYSMSKGQGRSCAPQGRDARLLDDQGGLEEGRKQVHEAHFRYFLTKHMNKGQGTRIVLVLVDQSAVRGHALFVAHLSPLSGSTSNERDPG